MGRKSRNKGKRGEREFADRSGGQRTWWSADEHNPLAAHDVEAHGRPWEVKLLGSGLTVAYQALEEFTEHELQAHGEAQYAPIVAARMDRKPWIVIQYYDDWREENVPTNA